MTGETGPGRASQARFVMRLSFFGVTLLVFLDNHNNKGDGP